LPTSSALIWRGILAALGWLHWFLALWQHSGCTGSWLCGSTRAALVLGSVAALGLHWFLALWQHSGCTGSWLCGSTRAALVLCWCLCWCLVCLVSLTFMSSMPWEMNYAVAPWHLALVLALAGAATLDGSPSSRQACCAMSRGHPQQRDGGVWTSCVHGRWSPR